LSTSKSTRGQGLIIKKYENIAAFTQEENDNLKKQNEYLFSKLKKMKEKEKKFAKIAEKAIKYKTLYEEALHELDLLKSECQAYKTKAEEMKKIALLDVNKLESKLKPFIKSMDELDTANSEELPRGKPNHN
jgi:DNA repair exonuclease SbcCD ATPase subunit